MCDRLFPRQGPGPADLITSDPVVFVGIQPSPTLCLLAGVEAGLSFLSVLTVLHLPVSPLLTTTGCSVPSPPAAIK